MECYNVSIIILNKRELFHKAPRCTKCMKNCIEILNRRVNGDYSVAYAFEADLFLRHKGIFNQNAIEMRIYGKNSLF
jgi:hypothetical protein